MASGKLAPTENFRRITDELLLLRSEHNDGNLTTLDELALHQSHLTKIEYINRACPNLRILLLQVRGVTILPVYLISCLAPNSNRTTASSASRT